MAGNLDAHGDYPRSLALSPDGSYLYALNQRSDNITSQRVNRATESSALWAAICRSATPHKWRSCRRRNNPWPARFTGRAMIDGHRMVRFPYPRLAYLFDLSANQRLCAG